MICFNKRVLLHIVLTVLFLGIILFYCCRSSLLLWAVKDGRINATKFLLFLKTDINSSDNLGTTALHISAIRNRLEIAELLLERGCKINPVEQELKQTSLHFAAKCGSPDMVELLLSHDAETEIKDKYGRTPLHLASAGKTQWTDINSNMVKTCKILISHGTDIYAQNNNLWTPLHEAAHNGAEEILQLLISNGAKVDIADNDGRTPLQLAAWKCHLKIMEILISHGADIHTRNNLGDGLLNLVTDNSSLQSKQYGIIEFLLYRNIDVNTAGQLKRTPLINCVLFSKGNDYDFKALELLLSHGADIDAKDRYGKTAMDYALEKEDATLIRRIVRILTRYKSAG